MGGGGFSTIILVFLFCVQQIPCFGNQCNPRIAKILKRRKTIPEEVKFSKSPQQNIPAIFPHFFHGLPSRGLTPPPK